MNNKRPDIVNWEIQNWLMGHVNYTKILKNCSNFKSNVKEIPRKPTPPIHKPPQSAA